jgi:hypothetical protein
VLLFRSRNFFHREIVYEKYLILFYLTLTANLLYHTFGDMNIQQKEAFPVISSWFTFLTVYLTVKRFADPTFLKVVAYSTLILVLTSAVIGLYQFLVSNTFFVVGLTRIAVKDLIRINGVFSQEYFQSYFAISGGIVALYFIRRKYPKLLVIGLMMIAVLLTFHRMSFLIFLILLLIYWSYEYPQYRKYLILGMAVVGSFIFLTGVSLLTSAEESLGVFSSRVFDDTVTGRMAVYAMVIRRFPAIWLVGVGSVFTTTYFGDMQSSGETWMALGTTGGIHNLYLNVLYFYGLPVVVCLVLFLISGARFYFALVRAKHHFYFIPGALFLMFILANFSNWFYLSTEFGLFLAIYAGLFAGLYVKGYLHPEEEPELVKRTSTNDSK